MRKFYYLSMASAMALTFCACGDDNNGDVTDPSDSSETSNLSVQESKEFLESSALQTLNLFKANDQKAAINFCNNFTEEYGDLEFPWDEDDFSVTKMIRNLRSGLQRANASALSRAASEAYVYEFSKIAGTYEPKGDEWVKTGNSNDTFTLKFNLYGKASTIQIVATGSNPEINYTESDYDWDWNGNYYEYDTDYTIIAPQNVSFSITEGTVEHASGTVKANVNVDGHVASADINVKASNLAATSTVDGNDSKITANYNVTVGGNLLSSGTAVVTGNNLCNRDIWESINDDNAEKMLNNIITEAIANANIIDKVQVKAKVKNVGTIYTVTDTYYDNYEFDSKDEAKKACKTACNTLAECITAKMYYNNSNKEEATIEYTSDFDSWGYGSWEGWEYYIVPVITFADGSSYEFEDYFEDFNFDTVANQFDSLVDSYERLWK